MNAQEYLFQSNKVPERLNQWNAIQLARLYANVFKGPPWNEAVRCDSCDTFRDETIIPGSLCNCGGIFQEAYPLNTTVLYIQNELKGKNSLLFIQKENTTPYAFGWGYETTSRQLVEKKWKTPAMQKKILTILANQGISPTRELFYISEIGVNPNRRTKGIATSIVTQFLAQKKDIPLLYRTNYESPMVPIGFKLGFIQIQGSEVYVNKIMKKIVPTGKIINTNDTENPARVLLLKL